MWIRRTLEGYYNQSGILLLIRCRLHSREFVDIRGLCLSPAAVGKAAGRHHI